MEIAVKVLGDRRLLPELHRLNPQLGPLPHALKAGQVIKVPHVEPTADAQLTGKTGNVRVRRPSEADWDAARRGMDLFRAWRVGAEERAAAEVTFADAQRLYLREHTVVIIYGPERRRARLDAPEAVLERGALRSRLAELTGTPLKVTTPSARPSWARAARWSRSTTPACRWSPTTTAARSRCAARPAARSRSRRAWARGSRARQAAGEAAAAAAGAGLGGARPLGFVAVDGGATVDGGVGGRAQGRELPHRAVARHRACRRGRAAGDDRPGSSCTARPWAPYTAQVASLDRDRLEGKPGPALAVTVRGVALVAPGAAAPALAAVGDDEPITPTAATAAVVARGARVVTDGIACTTGGATAAVAVLASAGPIEPAAPRPRAWRWRRCHHGRRRDGGRRPRPRPASSRPAARPSWPSTSPPTPRWATPGSSSRRSASPSTAGPGPPTGPGRDGARRRRRARHRHRGRGRRHHPAAPRRGRDHDHAGRDRPAPAQADRRRRPRRRPTSGAGRSAASAA